MAPPTTGYTLENDLNDIAYLTMEEIAELGDTIKRVDKRATSGALWTDNERYQDISNNQTIKYNYIDIAKALYVAATNVNRRHDIALHYAGILKRYVKLTEADTRTILESVAPNDSKILQGVKDTYKKKDNQITSIVTFRKLLIELLGQDDTNEIINQIMQHAEPELQFGGNKGAGLLLKLAVNNVEECIYDQDKRAYAIIKDKTTDSYQIIRLKSEEFNLNMSKWLVENTRGCEQAAKEHKIQTIDTLTSLIKKKSITLHNRAVMFKDQNTVYYNLNNEFGEIMKITPDSNGKGVTIIKQNPDLILFRKLPDRCRQLTPVSIDSLKTDYDYLEPLLTGVKNEKQKLVFKCWLIALFFWSVSYGIPNTNGGERQGKTTLLKMAKSLFDPEEDLNAPIKDRPHTLAQELKTDKFKLDDVNLIIWRSSLTIFDNISHFTPELEDEFCQWITGGTHSKRKLYDDTDMVELSGARALGYTGITNVSTRPDHIARQFNIDVSRDDNEKKFDEDIWTEFYNNKPETLHLYLKNSL